MEAWFTDTQYLLSVGFVQHALIAAALLGLLSGVMAPLIVIRQMSFSVHGTAELALMGASAALLFGLNVGGGAVIGSVVAAILLAVLGMKQQDSAVGVVMSFGLGLAVLFIHLYPGRSSTAFSLLTGQIVGVSSASLWILVAVTVVVVGAVIIFWRPLMFASADPLLAQASGLNIRMIAIGFAIMVGLTTSQSVQIVGALLVMAAPFLFILTRLPGGMAIVIVAAVISFGTAAVVHLVTLPVEFDASFNRALPLLKEYVPPYDMPGARHVLTACAFTYVAASLASILNLGRWLVILRR